MNNKSLVFALTACFVGVLIYGLQRLDDWTSAAPTDGPGQVVPDARVSAALPPPLAELAGGGVRVHDDAPPVVEPEPVHVTGVRPAITNYALLNMPMMAASLSGVSGALKCVSRACSASMRLRLTPR